MIYVNELPSSILSMETSMRLLPLVCAVTADKQPASFKGRMIPGKEAAKGARMSTGRFPAPAYGKAQRV